MIDIENLKKMVWSQALRESRLVGYISKISTVIASFLVSYYGVVLLSAMAFIAIYSVYKYLAKKNKKVSEVVNINKIRSLLKFSPETYPIIDSRKLLAIGWKEADKKVSEVVNIISDVVNINKIRSLLKFSPETYPIIDSCKLLAIGWKEAEMSLLYDIKPNFGFFDRFQTKYIVKISYLPELRRIGLAIDNYLFNDLSTSGVSEVGGTKLLAIGWYNYENMGGLFYKENGGELQNAPLSIDGPYLQSQYELSYLKSISAEKSSHILPNQQEDLINLDPSPADAAELFSEHWLHQSYK